MKYKFLGHVGQMSFLTAPNRPSPVTNQTFRAGRAECQECPDVKNYKWHLNLVWHRMLYSCTHMATVGVKGLMSSLFRSSNQLDCVKYCNEVTDSAMVYRSECFAKSVTRLWHPSGRSLWQLTIGVCHSGVGQRRYHVAAERRQWRQVDTRRHQRRIILSRPTQVQYRLPEMPQ